MEVDPTENIQPTSMPVNMTLTENASHTFESTKSSCLDFYFDVMQKTDPKHIVSLLKEAWDENAALTLKLIFQLRDIRKGKGASIEFHHALIWLFNHHPLTLIHNLQHLPQHGYWKDLSWLIKFLLDGKVATKSRPKIAKTPMKAVKHRQFGRAVRGKASQFSPNEDIIVGTNLSFEELVKNRVNGKVPKTMWKKYLSNLSNDEVRKEAKKNFLTIAKAVQSAHGQEAKIKKKAAKDLAKVKLSSFGIVHKHFSTLYDTVVKLFVAALKQEKETLNKDKKLPLTALVGKWAPTIDGAIDFSTSLGKNIARSLYSSSFPIEEWTPNEKKKAYNFYRKEYLTPLRAYVHSPETFMSSKKWSEISYDRVASVSMKRNKEVFLKRDAERFGKYLEDVKAGVKKIASGALLPHEIIEQLISSYDFQIISTFQSDSESENDDEQVDKDTDQQTDQFEQLETDEQPDEKIDQQTNQLEQVAELQWASYVDNLKKSGLIDSALSICDVSGSMDGEPMNVAIALSLLTAALSKPPFDNFICSFSESPSLHLVNQPTLKEKVSFVRNMDWGMNTNMQAVFDLILQLATSTKLRREDMVKTLFIFSDMEFDDCGGKQYETDYQLAKRKFEEAGYQLPAIVFWNLRGGSRSKPVTKDEKNVALVSGFSGQMMKTFLEKGAVEFESPYQVMLDTLGNHYDHLKVVD